MNLESQKKKKKSLKKLKKKKKKKINKTKNKKVWKIKKFKFQNLYYILYHHNKHSLKLFLLLPLKRILDCVNTIWWFFNMIGKQCGAKQNEKKKKYNKICWSECTCRLLGPENVCPSFYTGWREQSVTAYLSNAVLCVFHVYFFFFVIMNT